MCGEPRRTCGLSESRFRLGLLVLVSVLLTSQQGDCQELLWDHVGVGPREFELSSFDFLGDVDGDDVGDFILASEDRQTVSIRSGATGTLIHQHFHPTENGHGMFFGEWVSAVGLVDGDSVLDYAVGAPGYSPNGGAEWQGQMRIYSGRSHQLLLTIQDNLGNEFNGARVYGFGDVNGDGFPDFGTKAGNGAIKVYAGPTGLLIRVHIPGYAAASFADLDGDGCDDYLVGETGYSELLPSAGRVVVFSGRSGEPLLAGYGQLPRGTVGVSVSFAGDWNGDGVPDFAAGAPGGLGVVPIARAGAYVFSGADGSVLRFFSAGDYCSKPGSRFGFSISSGEDVNGDGVPDLLVSAPQEPYAWQPPFPPDHNRGSVFLFSGATGGLLWEYRGRWGGVRAGTQVKLLEDFNGDGLADWAILSKYYDDNSQPVYDDTGRLSVFGGAFGDATQHCQGGANSTGAAAVLWNSGPISVYQNRLELVVSEMPQGTPVILLQGRLTSPAPFGAGELCLAGRVGVLAALTTGSTGPPGASNFARAELDLESAPFSDGGNVVQAGDTWAFQAVYRDQGLRNTSNALEVRFVP